MTKLYDAATTVFDRPDIRWVVVKTNKGDPTQRFWHESGYFQSTPILATQYTERSAAINTMKYLAQVWPDSVLFVSAVEYMLTNYGRVFIEDLPEPAYKEADINE